MKYRTWTFPAVRYFTWKLEFVSNILFMIVVSLELPLLTFVYIIRHSSDFQLIYESNGIEFFKYKPHFFNTAVS